MIDFECQFDGLPQKRLRKRYKRGVLPFYSRRHPQVVMPDVDPGIEMGIAPLIAAAIPMVTSLAGSLMKGGGGKDGKGPSPEAGQAQNILDVLTKAVGGDESKGESSIKEVVANIVRTIPSPVLKQVKEGISQLKKADAANKEGRTSLVKAIDAKFKPKVTALLAAVKAQQLQTQATDEHRRLKAQENFTKGTTNTLKEINARLCGIEKRLGRVAIVRGDSRIDILGGRSILER